MPFEIGNKLGVGNGRKGYELEQEALQEMRQIVARDRKFIKKLQDKLDLGLKLTDDEKEMMKITNGRMTKILDKLHASKQDVTSDGKPIVISVAKEIAEQNDIEPKFKKHPDLTVKEDIL